MDIHKVLMVDDEPDIRRVGQMSLELLAKKEVLLAESGAQALELAAREKPDVIVLDVMMPDMDGVATLAALKQAPATAAIPVIFLTGQSSGREAQTYRELGAAGVIRKPFDPMTFAGQIERLARGGG